VVSKDHLHKRIENGRQITDEQYIIGEPISVYTKGKSTMVKGRLYKNNKHAQKFIDLLKSGSTRVKASVGGIVPKIVKNLKDGTEKVVSVLWNDLALTVAPVNYTVSPATGVMVKALTSLELVKSMAAGYGTDSSAFNGGRALQKEDIEHSKIYRTYYEEAIAELVDAFSSGDVDTLEDAKEFLDKYGFPDSVSLDIIREIASKHKEFLEVLPMSIKGSLFDGVIENIKKAMNGSGKSGDGDDNHESNHQEIDGGGNEETINAELVIKALADKIEELEGVQEKVLNELESLTEFNKSLGKGMIAIMEHHDTISQTPLPTKGIRSGFDAVLNKGNASGKMIRRHKQFTVDMKNKVTDILVKSVAAGELDIFDSGKIETQINKSIMNPAFQLDQEYQEFLAKKLSA
jgi:hypothetical protein